ncbi:IPT/TIG domain-containing protein [Tessaracoccus sp. MC1627]|uniref:phage tail tube protein n=1 Tax=Tessaracoccus sp. MC1627 TaxID=2760312 RepID=UPI0016020747|nr:IPT/TIG domain-containing protein [Tessaracoccus sp. MC1627]MBB1511972.1 IPT/TIG domain-containing protein [Tessaracoccus sp. MC1627]
MSDHPYVPVPASTSLGKSFEYGLDVNLGTTGSPSWQPVRRISGWTPSFPATTQDVATYDDRGAPSEEVTARGFAASFTVQGNRSLTTGAYLPEVEALMAAARGTGNTAVLEVRWYHKPDVGAPNPDDAGSALVTVEVTRQNSGNAEIESFSVTLTGRGRPQTITNPFAGWDATAPVITGVASVDGPAAGVGDMVTITGSGFLGATSVTFGVTAATEFAVINGATIVATLPAGSAGSVDVTVVTPEGTSNAFPYTRA